MDADGSIDCISCVDGPSPSSSMFLFSWPLPLAAAWFLLIAVKSKDFRMRGAHKLLEASPIPLVSLLAVCSCFSYTWESGRQAGEEGEMEPS